MRHLEVAAGFVGPRRRRSGSERRAGHRGRAWLLAARCRRACRDHGPRRDEAASSPCPHAPRSLPVGEPFWPRKLGGSASRRLRVAMAPPRTPTAAEARERGPGDASTCRLGPALPATERRQTWSERLRTERAHSNGATQITLSKDLNGLERIGTRASWKGSAAGPGLGRKGSFCIPPQLL